MKYLPMLWCCRIVAATFLLYFVPVLRIVAQESQPQKNFKVKITRTEKDGKTNTYETTAKNNEELQNFLKFHGLSNINAQISGDGHNNAVHIERKHFTLTQSGEHPDVKSNPEQSKIEMQISSEGTATAGTQMKFFFAR